MELTASGLDRFRLAELVERGLAEDIGAGDLTSEALFSAEHRCRAQILLKEPGTVCGLPVAAAVFRTLDKGTEVEYLAEEGEMVAETARELIRLEGQARALLAGERLALNLLGRLSGIATLTHRFVEEVSGSRSLILDTRKTTPGLRFLEKYAVRVGGGVNHRFGLDGGVLAKDNHLRLVGGIAEAVSRLRAASRSPLEIEAETLEQVEQALALGVERILLDNMTPAQVAQAVTLVSGRAELEVSGGITLDNVRAYAETGVGAISVGAITHSAPSLDVSMEVLVP